MRSSYTSVERTPPRNEQASYKTVAVSNKQIVLKKKCLVGQTSEEQAGVHKVSGPLATKARDGKYYFEKKIE